MPLHEWSNDELWEGVHHQWIGELLRWVKPRLPTEYRAYLGSSTPFAVEAGFGRPDVNVHSWRPESSASPSQPADQAPACLDPTEPDSKVAIAEIDPGVSLLIERHGRLVTAVEVISPRNKDRRTSKTFYLSRYLSYFLGGANLVLIDVLPRPAGFSFADRIAETLNLDEPPCPTPMAISYRVGEFAAEGGRFLSIWRRPMAAGEPLPGIPLPLTVDLAIPLDLDGTYARAAEDAYLT